MFTKLQTLAGFRFLIVEDEVVQAQRLGMLIAEMGGSIANISYGFEQARQAIDDTPFDCAILDVNLSGTLSFQLAEALDRKHIPFIAPPMPMRSTSILVLQEQRASTSPCGQAICVMRS